MKRILDNPSLDSATRKRVLDTANQADYEHHVVSGVSVDCVRSPDNKHWCPVVEIDGAHGTICRRGPLNGTAMIKRRAATCPGCLAAFE